MSRQSPPVPVLWAVAVMLAGGQLSCGRKVSKTQPAGYSITNAPGSSSTTPNLTLNTEEVQRAIAASASQNVDQMKAVISLAESTVLYNVLFSPSGPTPGHLPDKKPVQVNFYVGPPAVGNTVPTNQQAVSPDILAMKADTPLLVTMSCLFCDGSTLQERMIIFSAAKHASTMALYSIVPDRAKTRGQAGNGDVIFQVKGGGIVYDNVVVPVTVGQAEQQGEKKVEPISVPGNMARPVGARDVDLTITCFRNAQGNVAIGLSPRKGSLLAAQFAGRELASDGTPKIFDTGLDAGTLSQILAQDYADFVSVVEHNVALQKALAGDPTHLQILSNSNNPLSPGDESTLLNMFYRPGKVLYNRLFLQSSAKLRSLAAELEAYQQGGRPLRIRIETQRVDIPWQILHPLKPMRPQEFWGFRYELIVDPQGDQKSGFYPGQMRYSTGPLIFAKYHADQTDSDADKDVAKLGDKLIDFLISGLGLRGVVKAESGDEFLRALGDYRSTVQMIVAYTHAENGTILKQIQPGEFTISQNLHGPSLLFAKGNFLNAERLFDLSSDLLVPTITLTEHPLVVLNGCETAGGGYGYMATQQLSFPAIFLHYGARGVIATEAPIWEMFGYYFGRSLLQSLKNNQPASLAVLNARKEFLQSNRNPLGLLYSYYGGVDAAVTFK